MAEPLEIFGAIASSVQVADAALRLGRQMYKFLDELSNADDNVRRLRNGERNTANTAWPSVPRIRHYAGLNLMTLC